MILEKVFERFAQKSPVSVMLRGILENALPTERINQLFHQHAQSQREEQPLFSSVVNVMSLVVTGMRKSVHSAYESCAEEFTVSVRALYDKLQRTESQVSQALVRDSAARLEALLRKMGGTAPPLLPGYRAKILDGKHLDGTEHRLKETRTINSAPLPGHLLVVLDPELSLAIDVFPCEDAYTQERALLPDVLQTCQEDDLWIADRNFCTTDFLFGLVRRGGFFVIRQHGSTLSGKRLKDRLRRVDRCETGVVYEQAMEIDDPSADETLEVRRITVRLDKPTRDGSEEIHILTQLPWQVDGLKVAALYLDRWKIENLFGELRQALETEIKTLCYPKAALLGFCVGLLTHQVLSVIKSALHSVHGEAMPPDRVSSYYLAEEISATYWGMLIAIPQDKWSDAFGQISSAKLPLILQELASLTRAGQFKKHIRKTRKPPPKRTGGLREKHVSTKRLLDQRNAKT